MSNARQRVYSFWISRKRNLGWPTAWSLFDRFFTDLGPIPKSLYGSFRSRWKICRHDVALPFDAVLEEGGPNAYWEEKAPAWGLSPADRSVGSASPPNELLGRRRKPTRKMERIYYDLIQDSKSPWVDLEEFYEEIGELPKEPLGGRNHYRAAPKDTFLPIGKGNVQWINGEFSCYHHDVIRDLAERNASGDRLPLPDMVSAWRAWTRLRGEETAGKEWPSSWLDSFRDFIYDVGRSEVWSDDKVIPITLVKVDEGKPHGRGNTIWALDPNPPTRKVPTTLKGGTVEYSRTYTFWNTEVRDLAQSGVWPSSWATFQGFAADVGPRPSYDGRLGTLRRKDPSKPHGAGNSFWADPRVDTAGRME